MKKLYVQPELELARLTAEDILWESPENETIIDMEELFK